MVRLFFNLTIFLSTVTASAAAEKVELKVVIPEVAPFGYYEDGQIKGIHYEIFRRLEKESGIKFNYAIYPYPRLKALLSTEAPDLALVFASVCEQHQENYEIQKHLQRLKLNIHLKANVDPKSKNMRIVRVRGTCVGYIHDAVKSENVIDVAEFRQALDMLELGRADGVCALDVVYKYGLKTHPQFTEKLVRFKTHSSVPEFEAVVCQRKKIPAALKIRLDKALKHIDTKID